MDMDERYARHLPLMHFGRDGQKRLMSGSVLIIGVGGLGSPLGLYLAGVGVGRIGLLDHDVVELSNLQRQVIHNEDSVGVAKVVSAAAAMRSLNSSIEVEAIEGRLTADNAAKHLDGWDVVVDATDSIPLKYLLADTCRRLKRDLVWGSIQQYRGQVMAVRPGISACYRCLYPTPPDAASMNAIAIQQRGVLGVIPGIVGMFQATEVIKILAQVGEPLFNRLLEVNVFNNIHRTVEVLPDPGCVCSGNKPWR